MATPATVPIRISADGQVIKADQVAKVKKSNKDNVRWVAQDDGGPWIINFNKGGIAGATHPVVPNASPFSQPLYEVPKGMSVETKGGPVNGNPLKTYRYTVTDKVTGIVTHDPDIDVE